MWYFYIPFALICGYAIYNRYFHPLSRVPGPFLASITPIWIAYNSPKRPRLDLKLHKRYGSVVRISPNEVMFSNPEYFKTVYGAGTRFVKGSYYQALTAFTNERDWNKLDMLPEMHIEKLRVQKRFAGRLYSVENAKRHEASFDRNIYRFLKRIGTFTDRPLEIYHELTLLNTDMMMEFTFGEEFGAVERGNDGGNMDRMDETWEWLGWIGYFPWLNRLDKKLMPYRGTASRTTLPVFRVCGEKIGAYKQTAAEEARTPCLFDDMQKLSKANPEFLVNWGVRLALTNFGAGVDTMSWTLATVLVAVAMTPGVWENVKRELDASAIPKDAPIPYDEAVKLEYLQACMHEAMRLWPNIAASLPRDAPEEGISIDGFYIPEGYTVGMTSSQLGRSQEIFGPDADVFRPERWLEVDKTKERDMLTRNLAFGGPSRICPGMHVAWMCMSKVLAAFYGRFEVRVLNQLDGGPGPGGNEWREKGTFPTKWHGLEVEVTAR